MQEHLAARRALIASGQPGTGSARALAAMTDEAVAALAEAASPGLAGPWAVVAMGGWGSGLMLPDSDIDVLLLAEDRTGVVREAARALLYPLWDAGLRVGHQVRRRSEHMRACRTDVETLTATLTARVIAGDAAYGDEVLDAVAADARRRSRAVRASLAARERRGSPFLLEPDLKEGAGGRRDVDEVIWTSAVMLGARRREPEGAIEAGLLTESDVSAVTAADATICVARWELQRAGEKRMTIAAAEDVVSDAQGAQDALAVIASALERVRQSSAHTGRHAGRTTREHDSVPAWRPESIVSALLESDSDAIELAAVRGELDRVAPGLRELMTLRRPALSHTLTVGAHCIACAAALPRVAAEPSLARAAGDAGDLVPAIVAALAHDAGKAEPGPGHPVRSMPAVRAISAAWGLAEEETDLAERLVRDHLLLAEAALHTDPDDIVATAGLAERIGDVRTLGALQLLAAADATATGPGAWSEWHAELLGAVTAAVRAALLGQGEVDSGGNLTGALDLLQGESSAAIAWLRSAPTQYLASRSPEQLAEDARLACSLMHDPTRSPVLRVSPGPVQSTWTVGIAAHDRPRLFADLAGILALAGLDVLAASANGWDGLVIDSFTVRSATLAPAAPETWSKVERMLAAATRRLLAIDTRLAERRSHYRSANAREPVIRFRTAGAQTLVEVEAPDRVGLLHDIAAAISDSGLSILSVKAVVQDGVARDVFTVASENASHDEAGVRGHVAVRVKERLASL